MLQARITSKKTGGANRYDGEVARGPLHRASGVGVTGGETGGNIDMIKTAEACIMAMVGPESCPSPPRSRLALRVTTRAAAWAAGAASEN